MKKKHSHRWTLLHLYALHSSHFSKELQHWYPVPDVVAQTFGNYKEKQRPFSRPGLQNCLLWSCAANHWSSAWLLQFLHTYRIKSLKLILAVSTHSCNAQNLFTQPKPQSFYLCRFIPITALLQKEKGKHLSEMNSWNLFQHSRNK